MTDIRAFGALAMNLAFTKYLLSEIRPHHLSGHDRNSIPAPSKARVLQARPDAGRSRLSKLDRAG